MNQYQIANMICIVKCVVLATTSKFNYSYILIYYVVYNKNIFSVSLIAGHFGYRKRGMYNVYISNNVFILHSMQYFRSAYLGSKLQIM